MRMKPNFACLYGYKYQSCGEHDAASIRNKILPQTIFRQWHPLTLFFDQLFLWRGKIDKKYILNWSGAFPLCSWKRDITLKEKKEKRWLTTMEPLVFSMAWQVAAFTSLVYALYRAGTGSGQITLSSRDCLRFCIPCLMKNTSAPVKEDKHDSCNTDKLKMKAYIQ